ncbi:MAG: RNA polymerase sigma factor [Planctomycetaceae bacterium]
MTADDDRLLVARCLSAEPGAWLLFVARFAPTVKALARRYLQLHGHFPDDSEVEDILQEVFLALTRRDFRLLRNYDPAYAFNTYLGVLTRTQVHRVLRKRTPVLGDLDQLDARPAPGAGPAEGAGESEEAEIVERALAALGPRDAEVLRLRYYRELDYREIAGHLRIPEASVGQTLYRAKQRLLEKLKGLLGLLF